MSSRYFAYYINLSGTALASYELQAADDARATAEARRYLRLHPTLEIWHGARWVARMVRLEREPVREQ